ncbi:MucR family transcriptional regulator [Rhizobium sp. SL86]|jgi:predicted transcriptional regulator|uniref:MucR family transcriptional regulator n=1 Tax=Rhizobium sp. SL86 TaxID=2995148 RepID=UPI00227598CF|nr:MucR family transcriptional regulator [Rhizobium sp. SL86]MCY1664215.1 MucR family transcriptional regulator [Rhizobium sp. SL86]
MTEPVAGKAPDLLVELTADIVAAYVSNHVVPVSDLSNLIADVHSALSNTTSPAPAPTAVEKPKPPVPIRKSIEDDYLICLEDGMKFKSLKRHLMTHYNMTPEEYREKWGLPADYPMVAPAYAQARSRLAKEMGLGQRRKRGAK